MAETATASQALTELTDIQQRKDEASEEFKSIQEYLDAFHVAEKQNLPLSPTKLRKMVVGLMTEYKRLESEKAIGDKDKQDIFNELRKAQRRIPELERHKELIDFLNKYAPDKLNEAQQTATQRQLDKLTPKNLKSRGNYSTK